MSPCSSDELFVVHVGLETHAAMVVPLPASTKFNFQKVSDRLPGCMALYILVLRIEKWGGRGGGLIGVISLTEKVGRINFSHQILMFCFCFFAS